MSFNPAWAGAALLPHFSRDSRTRELRRDADTRAARGKTQQPERKREKVTRPADITHRFPNISYEQTSATMADESKKADTAQAPDAIANANPTRPTRPPPTQTPTLGLKLEDAAAQTAAPA